MTTSSLAAAVGLMVFGLLAVTAVARADIIQPWCLSGSGGLTDRCDFATFAQCQATAGGFGVCSPNPNSAAALSPAVPAAQAPLARRSKR